MGTACTPEPDAIAIANANANSDATPKPTHRTTLHRNPSLLLVLPTIQKPQLARHPLRDDIVR
jgi:hypothetical protein